jgi:hypothetical protein
MGIERGRPDILLNASPRDTSSRHPRFGQCGFDLQRPPCDPMGADIGNLAEHQPGDIQRVVEATRVFLIGHRRAELLIDRIQEP